MKPSERIIDIAKEIVKKDKERYINPTAEDALDLRIEAMSQYLDETWEKVQCKGEG